MTSQDIIKSQRQLAQPRLSCVLITISKLYSTSNVASFTADCETIMLVYHIVYNIQDGSQKPEVQITFLWLQTEIPMSFRNGVTNQAAYMFPRATVSETFSSEYQYVGQEPEVAIT